MLWKMQVTNTRRCKNKIIQNAARRNIWIDNGYSSNGSKDEATGSIVLMIGGIGKAPFLMKKIK